MTKTVEDYVRQLPAWQSALATDLIRIILGAAPELVPAIKWSQPVFESQGPVCYLKGHQRHLTFGFWRGAALRELDDRLESSGEKMAHIKFVEGAKLPKTAITKLVKAAVALNRTEGDPTLRKTQPTPPRRAKSSPRK